MPTVPEPIDASAYRSLGALLADAFLQFKGQVALIEAQREREIVRLTYLEARREVARVAGLLEERGIGAGDRVAVLMSNQSRWLLGASAVLIRGGVLVPLDPKLSGAEQAALLTHARPAALLAEHGLLTRIPAHDVGTVLVSEGPAGAELRWEELAEADWPAVAERDPEDIATIVYSSGTGGRAKGCMLPHRAYLAQLRALQQLFTMRPGHRSFSVLPTNHAIDFLVGFLGPLSSGATVIHQRSLRPELLRWTMQEYRPTHMAVVPRLLAALEAALERRLGEQPPVLRHALDLLSGVNESLTRRRPRVGLSRRLLAPVHDAFGGELEVLFCGGAFVDRGIAERLYRLGIPVAIGYGLTEACTVATLNDLKPFRADSVGRAVPGVDVRIHDPGPDGVGEVWIRGPTVMSGYLDEPELTRECLTEDGWLRTGDLGRLDAAHHLHLVGRSRNMIITPGGKNVYPEDIEGAFSGLPVEELVVFATDFVWPRRGGLGDERLVAVVRPEGRLEEALGPLRERNRTLPEHKRVSGVLPWADPFPRTASLKVKRRVLAEALRAGTSPDRMVAV
ncbi:MAG: AMP-binding protein [Sandaracinaceae bacterium]